MLTERGELEAELARMTELLRGAEAERASVERDEEARLCALRGHVEQVEHEVLALEAEADALPATPGAVAARRRLSRRRTAAIFRFLTVSITLASMFVFPRGELSEGWFFLDFMGGIVGVCWLFADFVDYRRVR